MSKSFWMGFEDTSINFLFDFFLVNSYKILCGFDDFYMIIMDSIIIQLNENEIGRYVLQSFQGLTLLFHAFCKICEHEIVLQEGKSKQKQFQVHNSYKTRE